MVEAWRASGLTQSEFARDHGITPGTFSRWVPQFPPVELETEPKPMVELRLQDLADAVFPGSDPQRGGLWEIQLANGRRLRFPPPVSQKAMAQLFRALEGQDPC